MTYSFSLNRALVISAIVLVAVIMGTSTVAPVLADHDEGNGNSNDDNNRSNCKDGKQGKEGWNCGATNPRKGGK